MVAEAAVTAERPTRADFYGRNRGGGLVTVQVSNRIGAVIALVAHRLGLTPTMLTLANLTLGLAVTVVVVALAPAMAAGDVPAWPVGLALLVVLHLGYAIDCADGQLARVTGQGTPAGARVDILSDIAVQIALVAAVGATAVAYTPQTPAWLVAAFAGTWMVNLVTAVMAKEGTNTSLVTSRSLAVQLVKLVRDYGAVLTVFGLVIAFLPAYTVWLLAAFAAVNGLFLLASIAQAARASLRPGTN